MKTWAEYEEEAGEMLTRGLVKPGMVVIYELFANSDCPQHHLPSFQCRKRGNTYCEFVAKLGDQKQVFTVITNNDVLVTAIRLGVKNGTTAGKKVTFVIVRDPYKPLWECEMLEVYPDGGFKTWPTGFCDEFANMSLDLL